MSEKCPFYASCQFIQYLIDNHVEANCVEIAANCNRPSKKNPIGKPVDIKSYGPQTQGEIKLAQKLGLLNTYKNL